MVGVAVAGVGRDVDGDTHVDELVGAVAMAMMCDASEVLLHNCQLYMQLIKAIHLHF